MILSFITPANQMINNGWTCSTDSQVVQVATQQDELEFCFCDFICKYKEMVFVDINDSDNEYKNDYRIFINEVADTAASTVEYFLVKNGVEYPFIADYGVEYSFGFNASNPKMTGIKIDWVNVAEIIGYGKYKVKIVQTEFNNPVTFESHDFDVVPYDEERANGTVKIEFLMSGLIQNGTDFGGLNLYNMVRIKGYLGDPSPQIEREELTTAQRETISVQTEKFNQYTLFVDNISSSIGSHLTDETLFFEWMVTDYNLFNYKDYRKVRLFVDNSEIEEFKDTKRANITFTLNDVSKKVYRPFI